MGEKGCISYHAAHRLLKKHNPDFQISEAAVEQLVCFLNNIASNMACEIGNTQKQINTFREKYGVASHKRIEAHAVKRAADLVIEREIIK